MSHSQQILVSDEHIREFSGKVSALSEQVSQRIIGQTHVKDAMLMALFADGHILLEGLPGLAKTSAVKAFSDASDLTVSRIQFTPDLLPADVVGTQIYDPKTSSFRTKKGPIFANLIIADEINRAPAKVQSALLEAMQERQVTIGDETYKLEEPFLVMATQNPIEQEGTYPLPEAQIDRFLFKVRVYYGSMEDEERIMALKAKSRPQDLKKVMTKADIATIRKMAEDVYMADKVRRYIVQVVFATREPEKFGLRDLKTLIQFGASPRASIGLERSAKVRALMQGRGYVTPQDVKDVGLDVLRHRILLSYEAEADNITTDDVVRKIFDRIDVP